MDTDEKLVRETKRWLGKIKAERPGIIPSEGSDEGKDILENVDAYVKDTGFFLEKGSLIEAFEAVVWAWSWLEIGTRFGFLSKR